MGGLRNNACSSSSNIHAPCSRCILEPLLQTHRSRTCSNVSTLDYLLSPNQPTHHGPRPSTLYCATCFLFINEGNARSGSVYANEQHMVGKLKIDFKAGTYWRCAQIVVTSKSQGRILHEAWDVGDIIDRFLRQVVGSEEEAAEEHERPSG